MSQDMPHKAILNISFSIYPVSPTGELSSPVNRAQLNKSELKHKTMNVSGNTYEECVVALKDLLEKILQCKK